jgi:hypothetical protein
MAVEYSPKMFFRLLSGSMLLKEYFATQGQAERLTFDPAHPDIDRLYEQWEALPAEVRDRMDADQRAVFEMGDSDSALSTVLQEAAHPVHDKAEELQQVFAKIESPYDRMLHALIHHRRIFDNAALFEQTDRLSSRYWRKLPRLPQRQPLTTVEAVKSLEAALRDYYVAREGRGRHCHVDVYARGDGIYYYGFLEDYPKLGGTFDDQGQYQPKISKDNFEVIFRFNPLAGDLEVYVKGKAKIAAQLQEIFARVCLETDLPTDNGPTKTYELNPLMRRSFTFPTEPGDAIRSVRIKSLRLSVTGSKKRVILEEGDGDNPSGIYDLLADVVADQAAGKPGLHRALLNVTMAELKVIFQRDTGRTKTVTVRISYPNSCNLRETKEDAIVRKYLKIWGLELYGAAQGTPQPALAG